MSTPAICSAAEGIASLDPLLTVAMPIYNAGLHLRPAVLSIVQQTFVEWELLLIDDGSTDRALEGINDIVDARIRIIRDGQNQGLAARLNQAIDLARGKLFARMDQDDISHPERFARQVKLLRSDATIDLVGTWCLTISERGKIVGTLPGLETHRDICRRPWLGFYIPHPTWMGRTEWFRRHRYASPGPYFCEDQEMLLRTYANSSFRVIPEILLAYRLRERISWKKARKTRLAWYRIQREYFLNHSEYLNMFLATIAVVVRLAVDVFKALRQRVPILKEWQRTESSQSLSVDLNLWQALISRVDGGWHV